MEMFAATIRFYTKLSLTRKILTETCNQSFHYYMDAGTHAHTRLKAITLEKRVNGWLAHWFSDVALLAAITVRKLFHSVSVAFLIFIWGFF